MKSLNGTFVHMDCNPQVFKPGHIESKISLRLLLGKSHSCLTNCINGENQATWVFLVGVTGSEWKKKTGTDHTNETIFFTLRLVDITECDNLHL
jgi:hypothetical protein